MPIFALRGLCAFIMHSTWQEVVLWNISSISHFGQFLKKIACPDLRLLSKYGQFLPQTFNLQKCQYSPCGAFAPSLCIPCGRKWFSGTFRPSAILVNFWKKLHVWTLDFFRNFGHFFHKLLISKNANIRATGPLHLHYAFHVAESGFLEHFVHQPFWSIFEKNCMSGP